MIEERSKDEVVAIRKHIEVYKMNRNEAAIEEMLLLVRSARVFKNRVRKSVNQDMQNMMNTRAN